MEIEKNLNIVLIGMMGAGKSYIGGKLAKLLVHFNYVDTDELIEEREGTTISEIFASKGERYFRSLEQAIIAEVAQGYNQIISIGGGAFEAPENREVLKKRGLIFYLKTPPKVIFERIKDETHRPLLQEDLSEKNIEDIMRKREKNYFKAHFVINTFQKQAYTILDDILREYDGYAKQKTRS